jgi:glycine/D-amino acid oxidase-like deaminating enzyme
MTGALIGGIFIQGDFECSHSAFICAQYIRVFLVSGDHGKLKAKVRVGPAAARLASCSFMREPLEQIDPGKLGKSATAVLNLRSGVPVWMSNWTGTLPTAPLTTSQKADVVVVGAGISGALVAEASSRAGFSTVVLDRRVPGYGSTAASTALLQFEIDTPLTMLADSMGFQRAARIWHRSSRAVADLRRLVNQLAIACDFRSRKVIYLSGRKLDRAAMAQEGKARQRIALPSFYLDGIDLHELTGIKAEAALLSKGAADVNPLLLTNGLLQAALAQGCKLFVPADISGVQATSEKVQAVTDNGVELECKSLVFATGYELAKGIPSAGYRRSATWAFATAQQPQRIWHEGEMIWQADDPYLYVRTTIDGRVLIGGEDEDVDDFRLRENLHSKKVADLRRKAERILPPVDLEAQFAWSGVFSRNASGLPAFGPVPRMPNCYAVLSYGGNGMTFSVVAAQTIVARILGSRDPDAELFDFR